ncbi:hypothetical protein [Zoogloea sp.]|uniref:hypothetical protein n=1 Tax=Zoogloea sp. TaxID=49181 RepID=UPI0037D9A795
MKERKSMSHDQESTVVVPGITIQDFADAWGGQEAPGDYLLAIGKTRRLLEEIREAVRNGDLEIFDPFLGRERSLRESESDVHALTRGYLRVLPNSINAWLESIGMTALTLINHATVAELGGVSLSEDRATQDREVKQVSNVDLGVTKDQIVACFPPRRGQTDEQWERMLGDPPKWMSLARIDAGGRGIQSRWNPARLAMCLAEKGHMRRKALGTIICRSFPQYLDEWEAYTGSFD